MYNHRDIQLSAPSQNLLELAFAHVFNNEFEKRKIIGITQKEVSYRTENLYGTNWYSKGKVNLVLTQNSKGQTEKFKMWYSDKNGYCYSQIEYKE